jgi:hypothetical protein
MVSALTATQKRSRGLHVVVAVVVVLFAGWEGVVRLSCSLAVHHFHPPYPPGLHGFLCHVGHFPLHCDVWGVAWCGGEVAGGLVDDGDDVV